MKDGRVGILLSDLIHLPFSRASNSSNSSSFEAQNSYKRVISHWRKGPTKILLYSLESLLQKRNNETVCKELLTSKHLEISSSKKIFTAIHWTPSCMKRHESEIIYALHIFILQLCLLLLLASRSSCRPASSWPRRWRVEGLANSSSQAWLASPPLSRRIQTVSYSSLSTQPLTHISRHSSPLSGQVWLRWRSSSFWNHTKRQEPRVWKNLSD